MWALDPVRRHLNHGSFGAAPVEVLERQAEWIRRLEANPTRFMARDLPEGIDRARSDLAAFVGADPGGIVFVRNASAGVASVLRSLEGTLNPGDEIVTNAHDYNAIRQMLRFLSDRAGVVIRIAEVPYPIEGPEQVTAAFLDVVGKKTRLVIVDHITSPTGLVFPVEEIVAELEPEIPTVVDGAHGPGHVPLDLANLGASWYTGNLHKWACAPKGAGFLYTRSDRREDTVPTVISHGWNALVPEGSSRYQLLFDWTGTDDFSPWLVVPDAIRVVGQSRPGGWAEVMTANHDLAIAGRAELTSSLGLPEAAPVSMVGAMASIPLPLATGPDPGGDLSPLMKALDDEGYETLVMNWPRWPDQLLRVSAHLYNTIEEYRALAKTLTRLI